MPAAFPLGSREELLKTGKELSQQSVGASPGTLEYLPQAQHVLEL